MHSFICLIIQLHTPFAHIHTSFYELPSCYENMGSSSPLSIIIIILLRQFDILNVSKVQVLLNGIRNSPIYDCIFSIYLLRTVLVIAIP